MTHFSESDWADYARGLVPPAAATKMAAHSVECRGCASLVHMLMCVAQVGRADAAAAPPEHVLHAARAIASLRQPERVRVLPHIIAELVFDSFCTPVAAGVRTGQPMSRQMLYEAGPYAIDLRLDHDRAARHVWLTGQVIPAEAAQRVEGLSVSLTAHDRIAATAYTNDAGEFQLEYQPQPHLQLRIDVYPHQKIELPLQSPEADPRGRR